MKFYEAIKREGSLTIIKSLTGELVYLLEGSDRAVPIDTCAGVGHLKKFVSSLTEKPVTVLLTHGHVDHAMGAPEFETVYMNEKDVPLYQRQCPLKERMGYLAAGMGSDFSQILKEEYVQPVPQYAFRNLTDGMEFDLGGLHIDVYEFPGHTKGSMVFLFREMRILLLGDACNNSTFLFDSDACPLTEYIKTLQGIRDRLRGKYNRAFLSHHEIETGADIMDNVLEVCREVMEGKTDDIPFQFMGNQAYIAKKCNEHFLREDGKCGNIIYSKEKLYK